MPVLNNHEIEKRDGRIPYARYIALWKAIEDAVDDPFFGLHLAQNQADATTYGAVGLAGKTCRTLREAVELVIRYTPVLNQTTDTRLIDDGKIARLIDGPKLSELPWTRHKAESVLATYVALARKWIGQQWHPLAVHFRHAEPQCIDELVDWFGCPVHFGCDYNELQCPSSAFDISIIHADSELRDFLTRQVESAADGLTADIDFTERVRRAIIELLHEGRIRLEDVADKLALAPRTLQRHLQKELLDYSTILDEVRFERARQLLGLENRTVKETAAELGFADTKSFRRSFKRWTGMTPSDWQAKDGIQ